MTMTAQNRKILLVVAVLAAIALVVPHTNSFVILLAVAIFIWLRSRRTAVSHDNVNADWTGSVAPAPEPATASV